MDRDEPRALQAPLQKRYRDEPADCDANAEQLAKLRTLTERYCAVYQTLAGAPTLTTTLAS